MTPYRFFLPAGPHSTEFWYFFSAPCINTYAAVGEGFEMVNVWFCLRGGVIPVVLHTPAGRDGSTSMTHVISSSPFLSHFPSATSDSLSPRVTGTNNCGSHFCWKQPFRVLVEYRKLQYYAFSFLHFKGMVQDFEVELCGVDRSSCLRAEQWTAVQGVSSKTFPPKRRATQNNQFQFKCRLYLQYFQLFTSLSDSPFLWHYICQTSIFLCTSAIMIHNCAAHCVELWSAVWVWKLSDRNRTWLL